MCWAQHHENYRKSLTHTLDHQPYVDLKVLLLIEAIRIETIVPLPRKLSIVFCAVFKTYYGVKEPYKIHFPRWEFPLHLMERVRVKQGEGGD